MDNDVGICLEGLGVVPIPGKSRKKRDFSSSFIPQVLLRALWGDQGEFGGDSLRIPVFQGISQLESCTAASRDSVFHEEQESLASLSVLHQKKKGKKSLNPSISHGFFHYMLPLSFCFPENPSLGKIRVQGRFCLNSLVWNSWG